jgi:hypothetical protein
MSENLIWIKSSYSTSQGSECVEVAALPNGTAVRDSKDPGGPVLTFTRAQWSSFLASIKEG